MSLTRLGQRRDLLDTLNNTIDSTNSVSKFYDKALRLLESDSIRGAMELSREPDSVRERYGYSGAPVSKGEVNGGGGEMAFAREMRGQNYLLARRLVEAGVPFVNVYDCKTQGQNWVNIRRRCGVI